MTEWKDYNFTVSVADLKAAYEGSGSHRLALTFTVTSDDEVIGLIAQLTKQFVEQDFRENVKDHLDRNWPLGDQLDNAAEKRMTELVENHKPDDWGFDFVDND